MTKTNAMRLLEAASIPFRVTEYEYDENDLSGLHAAHEIGMPPEQVFKTLVTRGDRSGVTVFCIPVDSELDLRRAASVSGNKKVEMLHVKDLFSVTGYLRGGCSPVGMKTVILFDEIAISAGIRGQQIIIEPDRLCSYLDASTAELTSE